MGARIVEQALPDEGLAEQQLDILLRPIARRQGLEEHHGFLFPVKAVFVSLRSRRMKGR